MLLSIKKYENPYLKNKKGGEKMKICLEEEIRIIEYDYEELEEARLNSEVVVYDSKIDDFYTVLNTEEFRKKVKGKNEYQFFNVSVKGIDKLSIITIPYIKTRIV